MSDPIESSQSCNELVRLNSENEVNTNNNFYEDEVKRKRHTTICVINEEDQDPSILNIPHIDSSSFENETTNV